MQEALVEVKLADGDPDYDLVWLRVGTRPFVSDFRGFLFAELNRGIRLFGSRNVDRDKWNLAYFRRWEKDANTGLNAFNERGQDLLSPIIIARISSRLAT